MQSYVEGRASHGAGEGCSMEMDKQAEKSAEEIKNLREQLSDVSAKEALSRGKAEGLEKMSKCCEE